MKAFNIISETVDGVVVHTKSLPDGTVMEKIGDHGYDAICRLLAGMESDEQAREFRSAIDEEIAAGKKVQLQIEEIEATNKLRIKAINSILAYPSIESFITGFEASKAIDEIQGLKF